MWEADHCPPARHSSSPALPPDQPKLCASPVILLGSSSGKDELALSRPGPGCGGSRSHGRPREMPASGSAVLCPCCRDAAQHFLDIWPLAQGSGQGSQQATAEVSPIKTATSYLTSAGSRPQAGFPVLCWLPPTSRSSCYLLHFRGRETEVPFDQKSSRVQREG